MSSNDGNSVDDNTLESLIEDSDGRWHDDEFRIDGPDLMALLRKATAQPAAVDEAMVERAWDAAMEIKHNKEPWFPMTKRRMKRALTAALAAQQGEDERPFGVLTDIARERMKGTYQGADHD